MEDDPGIADSVRDLLEEKDFVVLAADNGKDALRSAGDNAPDLIVLDVGLPDMSGYDVCAALRNSPALQHTPIIMLTAHTRASEELTGFHSGADDYVAKPFRGSNLLARIETALRRTLSDLDANPLTRLPGNRAIVGEIERRIASAAPFSVVYFDLNNFKSFNDRYGFVRGDDAIRLTATVLQEAITAWPEGFLGHVGGDDFVAVLGGVDVGPLCALIIERFDKSIVQLYDERDRARKHIESVDRQGHAVEVPLMGLAVAVVTNRRRHFSHPGEIALVAGDLKRWAKSESKSAYVIDRRT